MIASRAHRRAGRFAAAGMVALMAAAAPGAQAAAAQQPFTVIAEGLDNPRGLAFGADGALYVAEAGRGGNGPCIPGEGPEGRQVCFGLTGALTRIKGGQQSRVVTGLPSLADPDGTADGASDVSFFGLGFLTVGLHNDPAVRAQLPPEGRMLGHLHAFVPGLPGVIPRIDPQVAPAVSSPLVRTGLDAIPAIRDQHTSVSRTLSQLLAIVPGLRRAIPLVDVAGHEVSANPDGAQVDSNPQGVHIDHRGAAITDAGGNSLVRVGFDRRVQTLATFDRRMAAAPPFLGLPPGAQIPMESVPTGIVARAAPTSSASSPASRSRRAPPGCTGWCPGNPSRCTPPA